jgi:aminoglycoside phosphotransferase family enzyme
MRTRSAEDQHAARALRSAASTLAHNALIRACVAHSRTYINRVTDALTPLERALVERNYTLVETHISRVFLGERDVYKFKRPVNLGFLDFTRADDRRRACEAEVALNRRLAPDVYLGVLAAYLDERGAPTFVPAEAAPPHVPCEWAVHMRRLPDEARTPPTSAPRS